MSTYKEIHGVKVQYRDSDATAVIGDVWYNASTGLLKMYAGLGSWAAGGNLTTGRHYLAGFGTQTAAFAAGGHPSRTEVESYDGSSWTETTDINTARWGHGSNGTTALGMIYGGTPPTTGATESWDESSWTEVADMSTARFNSAQSQSPTNTNVAAFVAGGNTYTTATEEWEVAVTASSFTSS